MKKTQEYIQANKERFLDELFELLRIPSISADSAYKKDILSTAEKTADFLRNAGVDKVEVCPTEGNPIVYGEKIVDPNLPTVLVYGHYDVQPPDPLDLWESEPFEPVIKKTEVHPEGAIFARGSADDKGQFFMHVKAIEAMIQNDELPCNVKFMIEGEEEVGSGSLAKFIKVEKERLKNDIILISDTSMVAKDVPSICVGLRGLCYMEVEVEGANRDMHSGVYGGAVPNPLNVLSKMIGQLHDENGKIAIPGFYDEVEEINAEERAEMAKIPFDLEDYKKQINIQDIMGEDGFSTNERTSIRPSLDVNGMWGGYIGEGAKTVIPAKAFAKISMRLVPDQNPEKIAELFKQYFEQIAPSSVRVKCTYHHGGLAYVLPITDKGYLAAKKAFTETYGKEAVPFRSGGSIPIVALFEKELESKSVLLGFGLNSDVIHSPNENYGLFNFYKGIETIPYFYKFYTEEK
ncbi:dipeptidase [Ornithobacterium rhinotracheale]|uniref:dipeptidase n=1 Tax=Ornithobacterium rhinotracheale TaxID=28251 RepID=UPI00129C9D67|nr:dipeptidase [Ornithobacterium rhinotracheale]MRJ09281.1 dipeptidase [Ornithobacterium rhinotracheale]UOH77796.1 dipeptidase [Ornithobacterium rhinotracheale]